MSELLLTPDMAADARAFEEWQRSFEAHLLVKRERRPARRQAGLKGYLQRIRKESMG